jgi:UDP:flavonoid glycosyltransferase YjiC (YdhE family)
VSRALIAWELGGQLGHLRNVEIVARALRDQGHEVAVALRELQHAHRFLGGLPLVYHQAPFKQGAPPRALSEHLCYAHVLYASGFAQASELLVLLAAWGSILNAVQPDVLVADHSPAALLAARGYGVERVLIGSGFLVPPVEEPLGVFPDVPRTPASLKPLASDERAVLAVANAAAEPLGIPPLERLADLYDGAAARALLTFPELDPFDGRDPDDYHGIWSRGDGDPPGWPPGNGKHVFVYLSDFPNHAVLLREIKRSGAAVLVHAPAVPEPSRSALGGDNLVFADRLLALDAVAERADLVVTHGAHTTVALTLARGVPQLMIPRFREQLFRAMRVRDLGAGLIAERDRESYADVIGRLLEEPSFLAAASAFAAKYASFEPRRSIERLEAKLAAAMRGGCSRASG